jgi:hypothetical protein
MGMYVRVNLASDAPPENISAFFRTPDGDSELGVFEAEKVKKTQEDTRKHSLPLVGFIFVAIASPMVFRQSGQITLVARVGDEEAVCGNLRIVFLEDSAAISSNAPQPPV